jgi:hypothetical protein
MNRDTMLDGDRITYVKQSVKDCLIIVNSITFFKIDDNSINQFSSLFTNIHSLFEN